MKRTVYPSVLLLLLSISTAALSEDIRGRSYKYDYGDSVDSMEGTTFLVCDGCRNEKLVKIQKQNVAIRVTEPAAISETKVLSKPPVEVVEVQAKSNSVVAAEAAPLRTVLFRLAKYSLQKENQRILDRIAEEALHANSTIDIYGYTCTIGTERHNVWLSRRRAEVVAKYLRGKGVSIGFVKGKGNCCSVAVDKSLNRRVEIIIRK